jgi:hypothetical protein
MCDQAIDECLVWVTWEELETAYKLPYSQLHVLERMVPNGEFSKPYRLGNGSKCRVAGRLCDYKAWAASRPHVSFEPQGEDDDADPE